MPNVSSSAKLKRIARNKRHSRVRLKVSGAADRPRLCVFRSLKNIYAQVVDDTAGATLVSASSLEKEVRALFGDSKGKLGISKAVGQVIAKRAREKGIEQVRFDRAGYRYHGRVKALADAARKGGLIF